MANENVAQESAADDESRLDAASCIRGAKAIMELIAINIGDDKSELAANPQCAEECLRGVMRLLDSADRHLFPAQRPAS